jgi:hypothetical protein
MRVKFKLVLIFLLLFSWKVEAQGVYVDIDIQEWPIGVVVLTTGEKVVGTVRYYNKDDVIKITKKDGAVSSYSPVNVNYFITKNTFNGPRQLFKTFDWDLGRPQSGFKKPTFFEVLDSGRFTLIMREKYVPRYLNGVLIPEQYENLTLQRGSKYSDDGVFPYFYIALPEGEIIALKKIRKNFLQLCGTHAALVKRFAKKNKLRYTHPLELLAIVNYYNSL